MKKAGAVFTSTFPQAPMAANTAVQWSETTGLRFSGHYLEPGVRDTLISHELFHRIEGKLHLPVLNGGDNADLDTLQGRYLLQLEWRALGSALTATNNDGARNTACTDAILFRTEPYRMFALASEREKALEYNEGLAEVTGVKLRNSDHSEQVKAALEI